MGALISYFHNVYENFFYIRCRIGICGISNVGKTSILYLLTKEEEKIYGLMPNIHPIYAEFYYNSLAMKLHDYGGRYNSHMMMLDCVQDFDALIFVVDISDRAMFDESRRELAKILEHPLTDRLPIVVMANKKDLASACPLNEVIEAVGIEKFTKSHNIHVISTTIRKKETIFEALQWLEKIIH
ncbi:unnamed protein product, partial [Mesorhabditis belari]|uniref:Uncharacterized protein n=1 Tax=Mesorhabditis belari TaxID=2138241 RepID=A0AAF3EU55_9BILA